MEEEREEAVEAGVCVAESELERSFLRSTNTLRCEKMDDNFLAPPPRRTLSRSPPSASSGTEVGEATAAVMEREGGERGERGGRRRRRGQLGVARWRSSRDEAAVF